MIIQNHFYNALSGVISELPVKKESIMQHGHSTSSSSSQNISGASGGSSGYTGTGLSSYSGKVEDMEFPYCPDANKYEKLAKIGQGTFGYGIFFSQASEFLLISLWVERCICTLYIAFIHRSGKSTE